VETQVSNIFLSN